MSETQAEERPLVQRFDGKVATFKVTNSFFWHVNMWRWFLLQCGAFIQVDHIYLSVASDSETILSLDHSFCSCRTEAQLRWMWSWCALAISTLTHSWGGIFFVDEILILPCKVFIIMLMFLIPREELRMKCKNLFYPPGLYKVIKLTFSQYFKDWYRVIINDCGL